VDIPVALFVVIRVMIALPDSYLKPHDPKPPAEPSRSNLTHSLRPQTEG
jgi:hypothetical protein